MIGGIVIMRNFMGFILVVIAGIIIGMIMVGLISLLAEVFLWSII